MPKRKIFPDNVVNLATQLRYFRRREGLSQAEMAKKLDVSVSLYTKLEIGAETTPQRIEHFALVLHTTPEFLTNGTGAEYPPGDPANLPRLTDEILNRVITMAMDSDMQSTAVKMAEKSGRTPVAVMTMLVKAMVLGDG